MKNILFVMFSILPLSFYADSVVELEDEEMDFLAEESLVSQEDESPAMSSSSSRARAPASDQNYPGRYQANDVYAGAPYPANGYHVELFGEFLYWNSGFDSSIALPGYDVGNVLFRDLINFHTHYQPGFRIGATYALKAQGWDFMVDWVSFRNVKNRTIDQDDLTAAEEEIIFANWFTNANNVFPQQSAGGFQNNSWHLTYNQWDLTLGKEIFFSKYYSLRPNMGGRYINVHDGFKTFAGNVNNNVTNTTKMHNRLSAFGFTFGFDNKFQLGYGLQILGNMGVGLLYGPARVHYQPIGFSGGVDTGMDIMVPGRDLIPVIDTRIDLGWKRSFMDDQLGIGITIGYEYHVLINGFTTVTSPSNTAASIIEFQHTNLYMQGMNVGLQVSF